MTAATLTHLPVQVGGAMLASAGRAALWIISRYMRAPLTNTATAALLALSLAAGSNALFGQAGEHPSPLFAPATETAIARPVVAPVIPAERPANLRATPVAKPAPAAIAAPAERPIGNQDVQEIQRKLETLKLYTGALDGIYGKRTAAAIKAFEQQTGRPARGELTREIIEAIKTAPLVMSQAPRPAPVVAPAVIVAPTAPVVSLPSLGPETTGSVPAASGAVAPQTLAVVAPLPEPKPLSLGLEATPAPQPAAVALVDDRPTMPGRPLPTSADEAFTMAAETAEDALETIINGVQTVAMSRPGRSAEPSVAPVALMASPAAPRVGVPLAIESAPPAPGEDIAVLEGAATPEDLAGPFSPTDPVVVAQVQRGLSSLGFLQGAADGVAGTGTAKAIRNFETYYNYQVTGRISPDLLDLLLKNGAKI